MVPSSSVKMTESAPVGAGLSSVTLVPAGSFAVTARQEVTAPAGLTILTAAGPDQLAIWADLKEQGLMHEDAPTE